MYKTLFLILIIYISCVYSVNDYARATLKPIGDSGLSGSASFAYQDTSVTVNVALTGAGNTIDYTLAILNHGDLSKTASVNDIFNPTTSATSCGKTGLVGQTTTATFNQASNNGIVITGANSVIGLAFVIFSGNDNCNQVSLQARDLQSVNAIGNALAWGIIGIGNINASTVPTTAPFTSLDKATKSNANNPTSSTKYTAICNLASTTATTLVIGGEVYFFTNNNATQMTINAKVTGLTKDSIHGIHIHFFGDLSVPDGSSLGGHWNGVGQSHALPNNSTREYGDIGNICIYESSTAYYKYTTDYFPIIGTNNILGRSVAIHANRDNGSSDSFGARIASCVIGVMNSADPAPFTIPSSLTFADVPVCTPTTTSPPTTPTPTTDSSGAFVQVSVLSCIIAIILSILLL